MFEILKNVKLLILPAWLCETLEAHGMKPADITTKESLESILSADDVRFYNGQVEAIAYRLKEESKQGTNPVKAVLDSLSLLHTNYNVGSIGGSLETPTVNFNALYGKSFVDYDFFAGLNMLSYLPRSMISVMDNGVRVDPYIELASSDLFVMKFSTGFYKDLPYCNGYPERPKQFVKTTLDLFLGVYGFDRVAPTKLFELYTLIPDQSYA